MSRGHLETAAVTSLLLGDGGEEKKHIARSRERADILTRIVENNFSRSLESLFQALIGCDSVAFPTSAAAAIITHIEDIRRRSENTDSLYRAGPQRQDSIVLEKGHRLACGLIRQLPMFRAPDNSRRFCRIDIRFIEKAKLELDSQNPADTLVEGFLADLPVFNQLKQTVISISHLNIKAVLKTHREGIRVGLGHMLAAVDSLNSTVIRNHYSLETPLVL